MFVCFFYACVNSISSSRVRAPSQRSLVENVPGKVASEVLNHYLISRMSTVLFGSLVLNASPEPKKKCDRGLESLLD